MKTGLHGQTHQRILAGIYKPQTPEIIVHIRTINYNLEIIRFFNKNIHLKKMSKIKKEQELRESNLFSD